MTRNSSKPMLKRAGNDTAREKSKVRIPLADFTSLSTRPTRNTRITRSKVGEIGSFFVKSLREMAER